jgi:NADH pyrophosphatase NudC (nudix superfamily)
MEIRVTYASVIAVALTVGFAMGLFAFRQKSRWCPVCGATFACPDRSHHTIESIRPGCTAPTGGRNTANRGTHFPHRAPHGGTGSWPAS